VLRKIFGGCKGEEVIGGLRKSHIEKLQDRYSSPNIIQVIKSRKVRWMGHVVCMEGIINVCSVLVKQQGKRPLRKLKCRWEDKIMDLKEIGWGGGMDWIHLAQDCYLVVSCYGDSNYPSVFINRGKFLDTLRKYWLVIKDCCM
jgi:hypothetical protein